MPGRNSNLSEAENGTEEIVGKKHNRIHDSKVKKWTGITISNSLDKKINAQNFITVVNVVLQLNIAHRRHKYYSAITTVTLSFIP